MDPVTAAAVIGGGLSYLGSRSSARMSQDSANQMMAFQASQTGTGYQRAVQDMRAAGLNPMLAAKLGPASSGSGAMAQIPDFGQAISRGASSAQAVATAEKTEAETVKVKVETGIKKLDLLIKQLKEYPAARVSGFNDRFKAIFVKDIDSFLYALKDKVVEVDQTEAYAKKLRQLRATNLKFFNEVMSGLSSGSKAMLDSWFSVKEFFGGD
jgi:hypothetical protein